MTKTTHHFSDLDVTVVAEVVDDAYVKYELYEVITWEYSQGGQQFDAPLYREIKNSRETPDISQARRWAWGDVKWDGCSNWMFDDMQRNCMLHGCERRHLEVIGLRLAACYDLTAELLENFEG